MNSDLIKKNTILLAGTGKTCKRAASIEGPFTLIPFPVIDTFPLKNISFQKTSYDWLIFTSPAAVRHFQKLDNKPTTSKVAVVGSSTKKIAEEYEIPVDFLPEKYNSKNFAEELSKIIDREESVLFPCSVLADNELKNYLKEKVSSFERVNLYKTERLPKAKLPTFSAIAFLSASAAEAMHGHYGDEIIKEKKVAAIGKKAAAKVKELFGTSVLVPEKSTAEETIKVLL